MATARFGMTLNEVTTSLLNRNTNEANNFQLIDNLAMMLTKNNTLSDGIYIATDKIRARDGDGLQLQDDGGNGITIPNGGGVTFPAVYADKISLYDNRLGSSSMYGIGLETACFYFKANTGASYRWYVGANADGGVSDIMELSAAGNLSLAGNLNLLAGQTIPDGGGVTFPAVYADKISLYDNRLGSSSMYGIGLETSCFYFKANTGASYRWYVGANADGGVSDIMELTSTGLGIGITPTQKCDINGVLFARGAPGGDTHSEQIRLGRSDDTIRFHSIYSSHAGTNGTNYLQIFIHDMGESPHTGQTLALAIHRDYAYAPGGFAVGSTSDPGAGNIYASGDVSALTFTDRTPAFVGDALAVIKAIKDDGNGQIDHATLPEFAQRTYRKPIFEEVEVQKKVPILDGKGKEILDEITGEVVTETITETVTKSDRYEEAVGRDIGAMLSVLTTAAQQLLAENEALKVRVENLEKAQAIKA